MSEKYFMDITKRRNIVTIFPLTVFNLNNDIRSVKTLQKCNIIVEKADLYNLMQLRLCDINDQTKMFLCTIDSGMYEQIKVEQCLHVSFQDFVDNLYKILDCCKRDDLSVSVIKDDKKHYLEFYEKRPFKNLIHLYLPLQESSIETILFHFNLSFNSLNEQLNILNNKNQKLQHEVSYKEEYIIQLNSDIMKLNSKITEQENLVFNRNCEEINKFQQTIKDLQFNKDADEKKYKTQINKLQHQIDILTTEKNTISERLKQEILKQNELREDNNAGKLNNASLKEHIEKLENDLKLMQSHDKKNDFIVIENRKMIQDLNEKLNTFDKQKNELIAELEAEKNICSTKRNALQIATEEIAKANSIILKQNKDIKHYKKTIELRLQNRSRQDEIIKEKEYLNASLNKKLLLIEKEHEKNINNNKEFSDVLRNLKKNTDEIEEKYKQKISELQKKITGAADDRCLQVNHGSYTYR